MDYSVSCKERLPAVKIDEHFLKRLEAAFAAKGEHAWQAVVGHGGDVLGKTDARYEREALDWQELNRLFDVAAVSSLQITAEFPGKGTLSLMYRNCHPAGGYLVVAGDQQAWVEETFASIKSLFASVADRFATRLHSKPGSLIIHSVIPLALAFMLVIGAAGLLIPGDIRRSDYLWWIVAGTVVANLKLAQIISDRLVRYLLARYPYFRWQR